MRRTAPFVALAALLAAALVVADGHAQDRPPAVESHHRFTLQPRRDGHWIFDRYTGRLFVVDLRRGPEQATVSCVDPTSGNMTGKPLRFSRQPAGEGAVPWPTLDVQGTPAPRFEAVEAGRTFLIFDTLTGRLHLIQDLEKAVTVDPLAATVVERPLATNDIDGALSRHRIDANEAAAVAALKSILTAQMLFREGDKEGDGLFDYGTLKELADAKLIDAALGVGTKQGYVFEVTPSPSNPEFLFFATARPVEPGASGARYFATNHAGLIYFRADGPFTLTDDCEMPEGSSVLGR